MSPADPELFRERLPRVDFQLGGLAGDEDDLVFALGGSLNVLVPLAEHHDGPHSYYVLFDRSATWGHPWTPRVHALHLQRDVHARKFGFAHAPMPLAAIAQSWLIHRGCPPDAIGLDPELGPPAADETTRALERRLAGEGNHLAVVDSCTLDSPDDMVVVVALRALDDRAPHPFRVVVEEVDTATWTYTLREGGFATEGEARQWCDDRLRGDAGPLPPVRRPTPASSPAGVAKASAARPPGRSR
ncbi:hypothetical protein ACFWNK_34255 [Streptomyces sp. NPDC058417]|uniref:hypothetical protein n=1 Tax=unclassified Streptomyces TaxID=2593676 RepID=UPI003652F4CB